MRRRSATRFRDRPSSIMTARCSVGPERSLTLSGDVPGFSRRKEGSTMATTYCCPGRSPLKFVSPTSRSSAPSAAAFVCAGRAIASPLLKASQQLGGRGRGSLPRQRLQVLCGAAPVTQAEFPDAVLNSDVPVLVEFVADWCGPCRLISPVIEWASQEYEGRIKVVKIDHDANPQLIEEYKVYGLPALILFKDGREVPESRREGAISKAKLKEYLDSLLDSAVA